MPTDPTITSSEFDLVKYREALQKRLSDGYLILSTIENVNITLSNDDRERIRKFVSSTVRSINFKLENTYK